MSVQEAEPPALAPAIRRSAPTRLAVQAFAFAIIGILSVVLAISFAALIFKGPLGADLGRGATLMLAGGAVLGVVGAAASSLRGAVIGVQDAPAVIVAIAAAAIATEWQAGPGLDRFSTIAMLLATTTVAFGATLYGLGRFRLGFLIRYLPYPVIGGFMAATGWFLLVGAFGSMLGVAGQGEVLAIVLRGEDWLRWAPGTAIALALLVAARRIRGAAALPVVVCLAFATFYAALALGDRTLDWAGAQGLLLGPFPDTLLTDAMPLHTAARADWGAILGQAPLVLTAVAMAVVGMLLNLTGAELATGRRASVDADLRGVGFANIAAGALGGGPGYIYISLTLLARRFGVMQRAACVAAGVACALALVSGPALIGALPICVFGGITAYLGADLLYQWLWVERRTLPARDVAIVIVILIVAATIGFLEGILAGLAVSVAVFVHSCISAPVVRRTFSNRVRFSTVERSPREAALLEAHGEETRVYQLQGVLFFGTISKLSERIGADLAGTPSIRRVIADFQHVQSLDTSAIQGIAKAAADGRALGIEVVLCGLERALTAHRPEALRPLLDEGAQLVATLDEALEEAEEATLARVAPEGGLAGRETEEPFGDGVARAKVHRFFDSLALAPGERLIRQRETADDIFFLRRGSVAVELDDEVAGRIRVGVHFAGSVIGEMALFTDGRRSADVVAMTECEVLRLTLQDLERMESEDPVLAIRFHRLVAGQVSSRLRRANDLIGMLRP
ncbi:SulP family inorganic anion transporter [Albimonas sp. CAU 1670]|uniref:SulP family inorganic anion transporter n=1 Tax=Albimonas sp. CAU 1670 TaxID=3032599 RepID=UPI0023DC65AD|nr:SulP family inorganic anion transporter [Albimonas sp. CAU 1670]MDF2235079.1 SulP family inorganic anion transporter [Albimonas sp. CAU 1670]